MNFHVRDFAPFSVTSVTSVTPTNVERRGAPLVAVGLRAGPGAPGATGQPYEIVGTYHESGHEVALSRPWAPAEMLTR